MFEFFNAFTYVEWISLIVGIIGILIIISITLNTIFKTKKVIYLDYKKLYETYKYESNPETYCYLSYFLWYLLLIPYANIGLIVIIFFIAIFTQIKNQI